LCRQGVVQAGRRRFRRPEIPNTESQVPNPKAFTLIELLVVIAVIALLMAILLPVLGRVRKQAKAVACRSNLRQWGTAMHTYAAENDAKLGVFWWSTHFSVWYSVLPYVQDYNDFLLCPMAAKPLREERISHWGATFRAWTHIVKPVGHYARRVNGSYGYNLSVGARQDGGRELRGTLWCWESMDEKGAMTIPLFFDCVIAVSGAAHETAPQIPSPPPYPDSFESWLFSTGVCINRHDGGVNMCFLDGSVRKTGLKELWTLKWHREYDTANCWTKAGGVQPEDWPEWMRNFKDY